ncbi:unnamed protein product [Blumeria hordei]|uniref:Uncharacterized protein n=1 Tax=Blumeria hordei TaxID=2867405 RepID=A0A383V0L3_BLUHO|nr:unnamed protein product [Blumeria hordei]
MKFGNNLPRNQVPEWSNSYIKYIELKKFIQSAVTTAQTSASVDLAELFFHLDRNLETVDDFYNKKFADTTRRLKILQEKYGTSKHATQKMDQSEIDENISALLDLRGELRKLQWFGEVNRRGFTKITKKLDKQLPNAHVQQRYLLAKVDQKPFSQDSDILDRITEINNWLSILGDTKSCVDTQEICATDRLNEEPPRTDIHFFDSIYQAIQNDDTSTLQENIEKAVIDISCPSSQKLLVKFLQRATFLKAENSIKYLIGIIHSLEEPDDINQRNCLHRFVISIRHVKSEKEDPAEIPEPWLESRDNVCFLFPASNPLCASIRSTLTESEQPSLDEYARTLSYILDHLQPHQRTALKSRDIHGRLPLHYAAQFGFISICRLIINYMTNWGQYHVSNGIDATEWQDCRGLSSLDLSIIGGHFITAQNLLNSQNVQIENQELPVTRVSISKYSTALLLAAKLNATSIMELLIDHGANINWQDENGETAMHIAARYGHKDCAKILIRGSACQKVDLELVEKKFSWTPLHVACVDGHLPIVELLIDASVDLTKLDSSGWSAKEHAALRGHLDIAKALAIAISTSVQNENEAQKKSDITSLLPIVLSSMESSKSSDYEAQLVEPIKSFGHRYLTDRSLILVSLGSKDVRKKVSAIELERISLAQAHSTQLDTALSLYVSAEGAEGEPTIIDLPIKENNLAEPIVFTTADATKIRLYFDIIPTYSGSQKSKIGRGVALLSTIKQSIGSKRMSLQGDVSVPIQSTDLEVIGTINFNFLIITPFSNPNMGISTKETYWKKMSTPMVIGHRGLGKNMTSNKSLQLGENTLQSFIAAANLGANYVEFDVQLTKDHVPVIYHDFLVSETGIDAPVHTLTLEQFLHVNDSTSCAFQSASPPRCNFSHSRVTRNMERPRSQSVCYSTPNSHMSEKMKHTRDFKAKGFKANSRGNFIQAPFTTLEEMLLKLPEDVGFNIEMKYPMLHESEDHEMDTYAVELNEFVDSVLHKVYNLGKKRNIIFSSFNPDICLMLNFKQPSIPILFLTDAGTTPVGDIRASSLHEAIRFARRWNLLGIVSAADPLCNSPRLVKVVKENGLVCVSYGTQNNDPAKVLALVNEGIDAVIVDNVLKIRNGLTENTSKATVTTKV